MFAKIKCNIIFFNTHFENINIFIERLLAFEACDQQELPPIFWNFWVGGHFCV